MGKERFVDLIQKKKNGETLTKEEIDFMITDYVAGKIPDYQMSAMLMAIYFNGMENEELAAAVRRKGKSLKGCIAVLLKWSFQNCYAVDKEIVKAAGVSATVKMGIPGMGTAKKLIREYYLGK